MRRSYAIVLLLSLAGCAPSPQPASKAESPRAPEKESAAAMLPSPPFDAAFWTQWSDGTAEVAAYDLTTPRYNATRSGTAVTIFVTEPFSESARVKADPGVHPPADEFPVMKLNLVKDYQTGIYDYNEMLSAFIGLKPSGGRPAGAAAKISFSAQEWCGHVYAQLLPAAGSLTVSSHSYWDNQADQLRSIPGDPAAFPEDTLLLWARGYATPHVAPGGRQAVRLLSSFFTARAAPEKLRYSPAVLLRAAQPETLAMPGGLDRRFVPRLRLTASPPRRSSLNLPPLTASCSGVPQQANQPLFCSLRGSSIGNSTHPGAKRPLSPWGCGSVRQERCNGLRPRPPPTALTNWSS